MLSRNSCYQIPFSVKGLAPSQPLGTGRRGLWERGWLHIEREIVRCVPWVSEVFSREHRCREKKPYAWVIFEDILDPRAILRMTAKEGRALGNPGTRLSPIGFSKKTIKVCLIGPFKFPRERFSNVWHVCM